MTAPKAPRASKAPAKAPTDAKVPASIPAPVAAPPAAPTPPNVRPAMTWQAVPGFSIKPSLLAAASTFARVVGVIAFAFAVPLLVAWISGTGGALVAAIIAAQFGMAAALPAAATLLVPAIRLAATRYDLDAEGVRVRSSVIARSDQLVPWDKVTLLVHQRSIIERILGIESLTIVAYGVRGATLNLVGLQDAAPVRDYAAARMRDSASVAALFAND